ncbi:MAG: hypothetical protein CM15mP58_15540 [Burkholderiaceae bacterium]|nr:MAG: hypothetical protein CM15mP58_15540 [Burkholderiaceae bacterium]
MGNVTSAKAYEQKLILCKTAEKNYRPDGGESLYMMSTLEKISRFSFHYRYKRGCRVYDSWRRSRYILYRIIMNEPLSSERKMGNTKRSIFLIERCRNDF